MTGQRIALEVRDDGVVRAHRRSDNQHSPEGNVAFDGLDAAVIRLFEGWLSLRDRVWQAEEIRVFGSLLHRSLCPDPVWSWIEGNIARAKSPLRLELIFPADPPYARLAALPWEYLYRPATTVSRGTFLAADPQLVLCRYIPQESGEPTLGQIVDPQLLIVVSQPEDRRLGPVEYEDVVTEIENWASGSGVRVSTLHNPTAQQLRSAMSPRSGHGPDLVHFMGHGRFEAGNGQASLALRHPAGGADWIPDQAIAELFSYGGRPPRLVLLHCCEGGRTDFTASFAGVAAQLARAGVAAVVAMQYAVTNGTAIDFSQSFYSELGAGRSVAAAVQEARWHISGLNADRDPRLVGLPVLYLQNASALAGLGTPRSTP